MYSLAQQTVFPQTAPQRKLAPNLRDKIRYVVHYRNLNLYLQLGLVMTRIHMVLAFKQATWLKTYIDFNTHQRSLAGSSFLKGFFKLMNNSVFGKILENLRKRVQVELIRDAGILRKRVAKPNFCRCNRITDCLTAIQCTVATLTLNRPIYVGFSVLDLGNKIPCSCGIISYRGETEMKVSNRSMQHKTNIQRGRWENSGVAAHSKICNGEIQFEKTSTEKVIYNRFDRKVRESLEIQKNDCNSQKWDESR